MDKKIKERAKALVSHCMERQEAFELFADYPHYDVDDWSGVFGPLGILYTWTCSLYEDYLTTL